LPEDPSWTIERHLLERAFRQADAARWGLSSDEFGATLTASAMRAFPGRVPSPRELEQFISSLHLSDLAVACACACGRDDAWDHFIRAHRPVLYRAADAIDPTGGAREIADSLYADLYGIAGAGAPSDRRSLFRYFHGRSTLATWLRAVLAQRHVDLIRARRRTEALPDDAETIAAAAAEPDPDRSTLTRLIEAALRTAIDRLAAKERLRLRSYYAAGMSLAQIGKLTGEHEATVSRHLARTRRDLRSAVEQELRDHARLNDAQISRALELAVEDAGALDLRRVFDLASDRKEPS
jgi:RNA polymerase sigma factor (sigma-70 family)